MRFWIFGLMIVVQCAGVVNSSPAHTWFVELDGSGDFQDIQPAVNASAPGDTIRIGPGRFDTFHPCVAPAWTEDAIVAVTQDNLTFLGSGKEVTILGTETFFGDPSLFPKVICSVNGYDGAFRDMTIENVETGIYWARGNLSVENCIIRGINSIFWGLALWVDSAVIKDCDFYIGSTGTACSVFSTSRNVEIRDSSFFGYGFGVKAENGSHNTTIIGCDFSDSYWGILYSMSATGSVRNCTINDALNSIMVIFNSVVSLDQVNIDGSEIGIFVGNGSILTGSEVVVENTTISAINLISQGQITLNGSHLLPESGLAVKCSGFFDDTVVVDLSNNFWGVTEGDAIAEMIEDGNDDPSIHCYVQYLPFAEGPVPVKKASFGSVKALFR